MISKLEGKKKQIIDLWVLSMWLAPWLRNMGTWEIFRKESVCTVLLLFLVRGWRFMVWALCVQLSVTVPLPKRLSRTAHTQTQTCHSNALVKIRNGECYVSWVTYEHMEIVSEIAPGCREQHLLNTDHRCCWLKWKGKERYLSVKSQELRSAGWFSFGESRQLGSDWSVQQGAGIRCLYVVLAPLQSPSSGELPFAGEASDVQSILPIGLEAFLVQFFSTHFKPSGSTYQERREMLCENSNLKVLSKLQPEGLRLEWR